MKEGGQSNHEQGGTGENTPFAKSRKKERDNGHDRVVIYLDFSSRAFMTGARYA